MAANSSALAVTMPNDTDILMMRVFNAPRELVFRAWTDPQHVPHWLLGPEGWTMPVCEIDLRVGGKWHYVWRKAEGTEMAMSGKYLEVSPPERVVNTERWGPEWPETINTLAFSEKDGKTTLSLTVHYPSKEARDAAFKTGMASGVETSFNRLDQHLAGMSVVIERTFDAPVERVWRAITDATQMKQWYFPQMPAFQPVVGFETKVDVEHEGPVYEHLWRVTEAVPNKKIAYSWRYLGNPGESLVSFELFPEGNKTRLKLSHTGLANFDPQANPMYASKNFFGGWTHFAGELAKFLEKKA